MRLDYKEWYLVELYGRLERNLGAHRTSMAISELREHLDETTEEFEKQGLDRSLATKSAVEALGTPLKVADAFVQGSSQHLNQLFSLGLVILVFLYSACFAGKNLALGFSSYPLPTLLMLFLGTGLIVWKTKRGLSLWILPASATLSAMGVAAGAYFYVGYESSRIMTRSTAQETLQYAKTQNQKSLQIEHEVFTEWKNSKDPKSVVTLPKLKYTQEEYLTDKLGRRFVTQGHGTVVYEVFGTASKNGMEMVKPEKYRERLGQLMVKIRSEQYARAKGISYLELSLNTPVKMRFAQRVQMVLTETIAFTAFLCLMSGVIAKIFRFVLVRPNRLFA